MKLIPKTTDFIDIHSHNQEAEEGVFRIYNVFSSDNLQLPAVIPFSIGLHPWHLSEGSISEMPAKINHALSSENLCAIGEAGIDRLTLAPVEQQLIVFRAQAEIAFEFDKPLIVHCVKAFPELLSLRKEFSDAPPWIIHGFNANQSIAADCVKMGIYISLSRRLFRNPEKAGKIVKSVPLSMVFAETDEDSIPISEIYKVISGYYGLNTVELKHRLFGNYSEVFMQGK